MLRRTHFVAVATVVLLLTGTVGLTSAAYAKPSGSAGADATLSQVVARGKALIAQHAAQPAIAPHIATPVSVTMTDPSGDATSTDDPRGDIVSAGAGEDRSGLVFKAAMSTPSNPGADLNWAGETAVGFFIDTNFDGHFDSVALVEEAGGHLNAVLIGYTVSVGCEGSGSFDGTNIVASFPKCNIGAFRWRVESEYDTTPGNVNDVPQLDNAPDTGYSSATPVHRTGYILGTSFAISLSFGEALRVEDEDFTFSPVAMASSVDGLSVWATDAFGHVHPYGLARLRGASPALLPGEAVVAIAAMPSSQGYLLFTTQGRVFAFGTAHKAGDLAGKPLNAPIVGATISPSGNGYFMVGGDGGVFTFGDAHFHGSTGGMRLNAPVIAIAVNADNSGYWTAATDGGVFAFHARFRGSMGGTPLVSPVVGIARYGNGYALAAGDAGVFDFSDAPFRGSGFNFGQIPFPISLPAAGGVVFEGIAGPVNSIVTVDT